MSTLIVDASVVVKWFFIEDRFEAARALQREDVDMAAPDLVIAEVGNALWKRRTKRQIEVADALFVIDRIPSLFSQLVAIGELAREAMHLSATLMHPIYDCFYIALAQRENAPLVSADDCLLAAARKASVEVRQL